MITTLNHISHGCARAYRSTKGLTRTRAVGLFRVGVLLLVGVSAARGGGFSDEPVGARINLAKERILIFSDTIARQGAAAYPLGTSTNPASDDFVRTPPADYNGYSSFVSSNIFFNNGTTVNGGSAVGAVRLEDAGTITASYVRLDSHDGQSREGDRYDLRSNEVFLVYSRQLTEYLSVGIEVQFTDATLQINNTFLGFPSFTDNDIFGVGVNTGLIMALHKTFFVGLHGRVKFDRIDTKGQVSVPGAPIPIDLRDTSQISEARFGIGWQPTKRFGLYADLQYIGLENDGGVTELGRFYLGTEMFLSESLLVRFGGVLDTEKQLGLSAGVGIYTKEGVLFDLSYAYNTFPEVQREFGRANLLSLSLVLLF